MLQELSKYSEGLLLEFDPDATLTKLAGGKFHLEHAEAAD
jgi:hypothetical protein